MSFFRKTRPTASKNRASQSRLSRRWRPMIACLEDRVVPSRRLASWATTPMLTVTA
jgi:hypothetical protein